jgi:hypothetical protein
MYSTLIDKRSFLKFSNYTLTQQDQKQSDKLFINNQRLLNDKNSVLDKLDTTNIDSGKFILDNLGHTKEFLNMSCNNLVLDSALTNFTKFTSYDFLINNNKSETFTRYFNSKKQYSPRINPNFSYYDEFFIKAKNNFYS